MKITTSFAVAPGVIQVPASFSSEKIKTWVIGTKPGYRK